VSVQSYSIAAAILKRSRIDAGGVRATDSVSGSATGGSRVTVHGDAQMDVQSTGGSMVNRG
jgi:hypothetical protein